MRLRLFSSFAALLLLAACESASTGEGGAVGTGAGSTSTTNQVTAQPTPSAPSASQATMPAGPTPGSAEHLVAEVGDRVFFDFDKYDLKTSARDTLRKQADWMQRFASVIVTIEGHADERGTREYNLALGARRAAAVNDYLVGLGVSASRVVTISYGKERPEVSGSNEAAWAQNRRGVMVVN